MLANHSNAGKRLVKSPKVYIRDSGILHSLLGIDGEEDLLGHPIAGNSWEGFCIQNLLSAMPDRAETYFYRTAAGAEIDFVLQMPNQELWTIEIKLGTAPKVSRGFFEARNDLSPTRSFVVHPVDNRYPLSAETDAIELRGLCFLLSGEGSISAAD